VRYQEWMTLTARARKPRSDELEDVDAALLVFTRSGLERDLDVLEQRLNAWKATKTNPDWRASIRNQPQNGVRPVEALTAWIAKRKAMFDSDGREAVPLLQEAAGVLRDSYGAAMDDVYRSALVDTFVAPNGQMRGFKRYDSDIAWTNHVAKARAGADHDVREGDTVNGICPTIYPRVERYKNVLYSPSENLAGFAPPLDRRIEFRQLNRHTVAHEMLHWCCHETFRLESTRARLGASFELVLEGWTEWLTRKALDEWDVGGYARFITGVIAAVKAAQPDEDELKRAYFRGAGVGAAAAKTIDYVNNRYGKEVAGRQNKAEIEQCLANMASGRTTRFQSPKTAGDDFTRRVARVFQGDIDTLLRDYPDLRQYPDWVTFLSKGKMVTQ
jgi:hypothetical protein